MSHKNESSNASGPPPNIKLPQGVLVNNAEFQRHIGTEVDRRVRAALNRVDIQRLQSCFSRKDSLQNYVDQITHGPIEIWPRSSIRAGKSWAAWSQSLPTIAQSLMHLWTKPSHVPAMLDPFLYVDGVPLPNEDKGRRRLLFGLISRHNTEDALALMERSAALICDEEETLNNADDSSLQRSLSQTAAKTIPSPQDYGQYAFTAFWCLRAACRPRLQRVDTDDSFGKWLEDYTAVKVKPADWLLSPGHHLSDVNELIDEVVSREGSPAILGEVLRYYNYIGDLKRAEHIALRLAKQIDRKRDVIEWYTFLVRYAWLKVSQGYAKRANSISSSLYKTIDRLSDNPAIPDRIRQYGYAVLPLLWALTELEADDYDSGAEGAVLAGLEAAVRNDFYHIALLAVSLMGQVLLRRQEYAEAYTLWHYLWDASTYLNHPVLRARACCGLIECTLWLRADDAVITGYTEEVCAACSGRPGSRSELLLYSAFQNILRGMWELAETQLVEAKDLAMNHGLRLQQLAAEGMHLLIEAHNREIGQILIDNPNDSQLSERLPSIGGCRSRMREVADGREFYAWRYRDAMELLKRNRTIFQSRKRRRAR